MGKQIDEERRRRLIQDIIDAQRDPVALGSEYGLSPDDLAAWVCEPANQRVLGGLCVLADLQTQILLSRYRLLAAGRLIKLATDEEAGGSADVARRACVDLLKLDLKRADLDDSDVGRGGVSPEQTADGDGVPAALRRLLYGLEGDAVDAASPAVNQVGSQRAKESAKLPKVSAKRTKVSRKQPKVTAKRPARE